MKETSVLSVENESEIQELNVFPNPFNSKLTIEVKGTFKYQIKNYLGQIVKEGTGLDNASVETELKAGIYFLTLESPSGKKIQQIVKE